MYTAHNHKLNDEVFGDVMDVCVCIAHLFQEYWTLSQQEVSAYMAA